MAVKAGSRILVLTLSGWRANSIATGMGIYPQKTLGGSGENALRRDYFMGSLPTGLQEKKNLSIGHPGTESCQLMVFPGLECDLGWSTKLLMIGSGGNGIEPAKTDGETCTPNDRTEDGGAALHVHIFGWCFWVSSYSLPTVTGSHTSTSMA